MLSDFSTADSTLRPIADKVRAGEELSHADGVALYASRDIHTIGRLANFVREKLHGRNACYNRNRHVNYTNVCALSCKFCSFYRKRGEEGAYEMPVEQVVATARKAADGGATEVHIVGGLHPWLKFDYYLDMLRGIRAACPSLHIKAFTAIEIIHFSRIAHLSIEEVLLALREAGLGSMPGGGAEIFDDRVHDAVFKGKVRADKWFEVHRTAHRLGIYTNATMLYGHVESPAERITHMVKLRELQAEAIAAQGSGFGVQGSGKTPQAQNSGFGVQGSGKTLQAQNSGFGVQGSDAAVLDPEPRTLNPLRACFNCFIPLPFIPENSELGHLPGPTGLSDLKTLAISRLMLTNIPHIKAFWIMQSVNLAQLALNWGCDDFDGTVVWYDITKRSGEGTTHQEVHTSDIIRLMREAGCTPVERDTLYNAVNDHVLQP